MTRVRRYSEMIREDTFEDRFEYLKLDGIVGRSTFGFDRFINQKFYHSPEWKDAKRFVTIRDNGCDLGVRGYEINGAFLIHHLNPVSVDNIIHRDDWILDPEFLICTTHNTHNAIHFGDASKLKIPSAPRRAGDTKLW